MFTISTRALGKRKPLLADFSVNPPPDFRDRGETRLRDLIEVVVRQQVAEFNRRGERSRFERVLSASQIDRAAARGKVDPAAKEHVREADADEAVAAALIGFEDGLYLVLIDEAEKRDLDEVVYLSDESRITFIRLTFLAGA